MSRIEYIRKRACDLTKVSLVFYRFFKGTVAREVVYGVMRKLGYYGIDEMVLESGVHREKKLTQRSQLAIEVIFNEIDQHRRARLR